MQGALDITSRVENSSYDEGRDSGVVCAEQTRPKAKAASSFVEVALPMRLSHKWVAYACRTAGVAKPRWNRATHVWTTHAIAETGATSLRDLGRVMADVMPQIAGRADGSAVSQLVREKLA